MAALTTATLRMAQLLPSHAQDTSRALELDVDSMLTLMVGHRRVLWLH